MRYLFPSTRSVPMEAAPPELTLLADLDRRQNEVINELDRLNETVLQAIQAWSAIDLPAPQGRADLCVG